MVARAGDEPATRGELVSACVENREKSYECKEPFIEAMIDLRASKSGRTPSPEERAQMKAKGIEEITEDGSGPLAPRQAKCAAMIDGMTRQHRKVTRTHLAAFDRCYAQTDCNQRVACMIPVLAELMFFKK
jgi:hypothetical protein